MIKWYVLALGLAIWTYPVVWLKPSQLSKAWSGKAASVKWASSSTSIHLRRSQQAWVMHLLFQYLFNFVTSQV